MIKRDFDALLLEAVDEGLSTIGESSKHAIYFHLENHFGVKREEIPCRIEAFAHSMEQIFGLGANFLEILIMKRFHKKAGGRFKWNRSRDFTFAEYVAATRHSFLEKKRTDEEVQWEQVTMR